GLSLSSCGDASRVIPPGRWSRWRVTVREASSVPRMRQAAQPQKSHHFRVDALLAMVARRPEWSRGDQSVTRLDFRAEISYNARRGFDLSLACVSPTMQRSSPLDVRPEVAAALRDKLPVVALSSAPLAHSLPWPINLEAAKQAEAAVRREGGV